MLKGEVGSFFKEFHANAKLPKGFTSYFLTLVPKVKSPMSLGDFRPISLLGSLYKLVAKVLVARLGKVMDNIVVRNQPAFICGRHLADGVVVVNELVDYAKKVGRECMIFKMDFKKAFVSKLGVLGLFVREVWFFLKVERLDPSMCLYQQSLNSCQWLSNGGD